MARRRRQVKTARSIERLYRYEFIVAPPSIRRSSNRLSPEAAKLVRRSMGRTPRVVIAPANSARVIVFGMSEPQVKKAFREALGDYVTTLATECGHASRLLTDVV